ncbi:putative K domain-containing protein [Helianthus annuus]|nr:putative K domain-containing protein [Helianthus annuus]
MGKDINGGSIRRRNFQKWNLDDLVLAKVKMLGEKKEKIFLLLSVLYPFHKIGRVIGRGGASIKSVREASGVRVDVDDTRRDECIVTVQATESLDDIKSMAVEAVLLLEGKINEDEEENVSIRLLVPSKVIGCIIGKSGSIINKFRKRTRVDVRISKGDKPKCADAND